jgi:hypothetical protein
MDLKNFALGTGLLLTGLGVLGFVSRLRRRPRLHDPALRVDSGYGRILGLVPTNTPFNFVRLTLGVWGLAASRDREDSLNYARAIAMLYAPMALMGFVPGLRSMFGLMPIHGSNILLHAGGATAAAVAAEMLPPFNDVRNMVRNFEISEWVA